eukprot:scaffold3536_cov146-Isochrysis_galbana.AAC.2
MRTVFSTRAPRRTVVRWRCRPHAHHREFTQATRDGRRGGKRSSAAPKERRRATRSDCRWAHARAMHNAVTATTITSQAPRHATVAGALGVAGCAGPSNPAARKRCRLSNASKLLSWLSLSLGAVRSVSRRLECTRSGWIDLGITAMPRRNAHPRATADADARSADATVSTAGSLNRTGCASSAAWYFAGRAADPSDA